MAKMLRLFKIEPPKAEPIYCYTKRQAKIRRDRLRDDGIEVSVLRGPDHRRGETFAQ